MSKKFVYIKVFIKVNLSLLIRLIIFIRVN